jgi:hypothetical protein
MKRKAMSVVQKKKRKKKKPTENSNRKKKKRFKDVILGSYITNFELE